MLENEAIFIVLAALCIIYSYIIATSEVQTPIGHNFVLPRCDIIANRVFTLSDKRFDCSDTKADFDAFVRKKKEVESPSWEEADWPNTFKEEPFGGGGNWMDPDERKEPFGANEGRLDDDFFFDPGVMGQKNQAAGKLEPEIDEPSDHFLCRQGWATFRSNTNFKYLWMHGEMDIMMSSTATMDSPLHRRAFEIFPVDPSCGGGGYVRLREGDSKGFVYMVAPNGSFVADEWTVRIGTSSDEESLLDGKYHFVLEMDGYVFNKAAKAFLNVMPQSGYTVRGHSGSWDRSRRAGREC